jgi:hypothetical protein
VGDLWWLAILTGPLGFGAGCLIAVLIVSAWFPPLAKEDESVPKTPWEDRVKMLLNKPEIVWYYKAPDGKMYGGQPRIDFIASDIFGRFIMIEVKSLPDAAKSFDPNLLVPTVQRDALDRIAGTASGVAILAVGHADILRLYNWGAIRERARISVEQAEGTFWVSVWNGPAKWAQYNLHAILVKNWKQEPGPYSGLGPLAYVSTASIWTSSYSAPPASMPHPDPYVAIAGPPILLSGMEPRPIGATKAGLEAMMSAAGASVPTLEPVPDPMMDVLQKRTKPVPPAPPPEKTSGEKRKEILKKANRQHHARQ